MYVSSKILCACCVLTFLKLFFENIGEERGCCRILFSGGYSQLYGESFLSCQACRIVELLHKYLRDLGSWDPVFQRKSFSFSQKKFTFFNKIGRCSGRNPGNL